MLSNLIVLLVCASLQVQGAYIPLLNVTYGLSEEQLEALDQIITFKEEAFNAFQVGFGAAFSILLAGVQGTAASTSIPTITDGVPPFYDSLGLAVGDPDCSAIETARTAALANFDVIQSQLTTSIALALSGGDSVTIEAIEVQQTLVLVQLGNTLSQYYDALEACVSFTDDEFSTVIQESHDEAFNGAVNATSYIFDAIKAPITADDAESAVSDITAAGNEAVAIISNVVNIIWGTLKTIYLYPRLDQSGILSSVATNQFALTDSYDRYVQAYGTLFQVLVDYATEINNTQTLVNFVDSTDSLNTLIAQFASAGTTTLNAILTFESSNQDDLDAIRQEFNSENIEADIAFVQGVFAAVEQGDDFSATVSQIEEYRNVAVSPVPTNTKNIFLLIRNDRSWGDEIDAEIDALEQQATEGIEFCSNKFFDAVLILARNVFTGEVSEDDFTSYDNLLDEAYSGVADFLQAVSAAGISVLEAAYPEQIVDATETDAAVVEETPEAAEADAAVVEETPEAAEADAAVVGETAEAAETDTSSSSEGILGIVENLVGNLFDSVLGIL